MSHACDDNHPTPLTRFSDLSGNDPLEITLAWAGLKRMFVNMAPKYVAKDAMPLISGGKFGTQFTAKGSARHDGNVLCIRVLVVDVDDWPFPVEEAMERLRLAGVAAVLFTTPSHMVVKGNGIAGARFRLVLPLSTPTDHAGMTVAMNRVNELLDGHVAPESWKPAQSYYCGRLLHGPWFTDSCEGQFIDLATHIKERASSQPIPVKAFVHQAVNAAVPVGAGAGSGSGSGAGFTFPTAPAAQPVGRGRPNKQTAFMIGRMKAKGLFIGLQADGSVWMKCPFCHLHSTKDTPGDCAWFPPHTLGYSRGHFKCMHTNHGGRQLTDQDFLDALDIPPAAPANSPMGPALAKFIAVRATGRILHLPTMKEWPPSSVDGYVPRSEWPVGSTGERIAPSVFLTRTEGQPTITQYAWLPGEATPVIHDALERDGMVTPHQGDNVLNIWRPIDQPVLRNGIFDVEPWLAHGRMMIPKPSELWHAIHMLAYHLQHPGVKINHALILLGSQGIGKDLWLEPLVRWLTRVGWWKETTPQQITGQFNDFAMCVFLRLNEIMASVDPHAKGAAFHTFMVLYEILKIYMKAPPMMLPINRKGEPILLVPNVLLLIITCNAFDAVLNLPPEDRHAFIIRSELRRADMPPDHHAQLAAWYDAGGTEAVISWLLTLDVSGFNPKAPPPMTEAKASVIQFSADPLEAVMADLLDAMGRPVVTDMGELARQAMKHGMLFDELLPNVPRYRNRCTAWLRACGYRRVSSPDTSTGHFIVNRKRTAVYVREDSLSDALSFISLHYGI